MEPVPLSLSGAQLFEDGEARRILETEILPRYITQSRWFGGKARDPRHFRLQELLPVSSLPGSARIALVQVEYADGAQEVYSIPLQVRPLEDAPTGGDASVALIARMTDGTALFDAVYEDAFRDALLRLMLRGETLPGKSGTTVGTRGSGLPADLGELSSRALKVEQSNSSIVYGDRIFVKLFRKLEEGMNPDVEIMEFLSGRLQFPHVPPFAGTIEYRPAGGETRVLALGLGLVRNKGDAWVSTLEEVRGFYSRVLAQGDTSAPDAVPDLFDLAPDPIAVSGLLGNFDERVQQLGVRTGEMHLALASDQNDPAFAPEPFTVEDRAQLVESIRQSVRNISALIRQRIDVLEENQGIGAALVEAEPELLKLIEEGQSHEIQATKTRTHGDYHLGQVLDTGSDFIIIDFEGEPQRSLAERKQKRSPLRDVAGMLRSFHYAAHSGLGDDLKTRSTLEPWAEAWAKVVSRRYLRSWLDTVSGASFLPSRIEDTKLLLEAFLLEKAIYEVNYELNNRPAWLPIPAKGVLQLVGK